MAYFFPLSGYTSFLFGTKNTFYPDFSSLWLSFFSGDKYSLIALGVAFLAAVFVTAYVTTIVTRSIRVGEFGLTKIINSVNENFFPALASVIFVAFSAFVSHNLFVLVCYLFLQIRSMALSITLIVILFVGICVLTVYVWSALTLWVPTMSFSGQYVLRAFSTSFYKSRSYQRYFFVPGLVMLAIAYALSLLSHLVGTLWYIRWIIDGVCYAILLCYSYSFTAISYCETESITREDMVRRYFGR